MAKRVNERVATGLNGSKATTVLSAITMLSASLGMATAASAEPAATNSPVARDVTSGQASGKRQHKPVVQESHQIKMQSHQIKMHSTQIKANAQHTTGTQHQLNPQPLPPG